MPNAAAGLHPFDPTGRKNPLYSGGFLILDRSFMKNGERGDSRMGMPAEVRCRWPGNVKKIQEHERLDELADIRRAHQARDRSMPMSSGAKRNGALHVAGFQNRAHAAIAAMFAVRSSSRKAPPFAKSAPKYASSTAPPCQAAK